jgi:prepilin-type N-terminal cleavage/methylation domain-containing protein
MAGNAFCNRCKRAKNARGITLVELIVVLVIMAILAGAGIGSAVGFIKRSRLTQNEDNANTIYQAVQTALLQMEKGGSLSSWVEKKVVADGQSTPFSNTDGAANPSSNTTLESSFDETKFFDDSEAKANESKHMRFVLTYIPGSDDAQSTTLKELIQPYFYDAIIFEGTITVELDVEKVFDARLEPHYAAGCLSVFFCSQEKNGWNGQTIPGRSLSDRAKKFIGYYDGYIGYSLDTVYLPKIEDGLAIESFTYDKNTGDLTWVVSLEGKLVTGRGKHINYQIDLYKDGTHNKRFILNEDFLIDGVSVDNNSKGVDIYPLLAAAEEDGAITIGSKTYPVTVTSQDVVYVDQGNTTATVYKKSIEIDAFAYTSFSGYSELSATAISTSTNPVKLTITYVWGEPGKDPYIEYSLNIGEYSNDNNKAKLIACPNDFNREKDLAGCNDRSGIVPMNKAEETGIVPYVPPVTDDSEEGEDDGSGD